MGVPRNLNNGSARSRFFGAITFFIVFTAIVQQLVVVLPAKAASASDFNPGNIISDTVFFDGGSMSAQVAQDFLNSKVAACLSGYTCLKNYSQSTPAIPGDQFCASYPGSSGESAASIIANVGYVCGVNPKVLMVLLEKEQSLVSDNWPLASQYRNATGFACPDTAPCDPTFSGFFYQVYYAARQFKIYAATPNSWNYKAGQFNSVSYHPNAACGASSLYISNQATAGLFIYTPYQPNAAALNNLYGAGDSCSAYGNRNFWRLFTDWFGTTQSSTIVRTPENGTLYVISSGMKYPIASGVIWAAFAPLGNVTYVSQSYLDRLQTGQMAGRIVRSPDGSIYLIHGGLKYPFPSCALVVDFGGLCDATGYVQLTDQQISYFRTGASLTSIADIGTGKRYQITLGTKREILDDESQRLAGLNSNVVSLPNSAISGLRVGPPIVREEIFFKTVDTGEYYFLSGGTKYPLLDPVALNVNASGRFAGTLASTSAALISTSAAPFQGLVVQPNDPGTFFVVTGNSRVQIPRPLIASELSAVSVTPQFLGSFQLDNAQLSPGSFVKAPGNGTIFLVMANDIRPISSWETLTALTPPGTLISWNNVSDALVANSRRGPVALTSGNMYRDDSSATVYVINGVTDKIGFSSFVFPVEAGFSTFSFTSTERISAYPANSKLLKFGIKCGSQKYIGAGGKVHRISPQFDALYPFDFVDLDTFTCQSMKIGLDAGAFIRTPDGSVYQLEGGLKKPISGMARLSQLLPAGGSWLDVHPWLADLIPTGPPA